MYFIKFTLNTFDPRSNSLGLPEHTQVNFWTRLITFGATAHKNRHTLFVYIFYCT
jgi:hypothetical protein